MTCRVERHHCRSYALRLIKARCLERYIAQSVADHRGGSFGRKVVAVASTGMVSVAMRD